MEAELASLDIKVRFSKYLLVFVLIVVLGVYAVTFYGSKISGDPADWGVFGDYVGGVLNPLIAFGAFYWLATSVRLQKGELAATRQELYESRAALLESQKAQRDQADTALISAQIESFNIRLSSIYAQLAHLRNHEARLMDIQTSRGPHGLCFDDNGNPTQAVLILNNVRAQIKLVEEKEHELLDQVDVKAKKFKTEVYATYSN